MTNIGIHGKQEPEDGLHGGHTWLFPTEADRLAFTNVTGVPDQQVDLIFPRDHWKVCIQEDTGARYHLISVAPGWAEITPGTVATETNKIQFSALKNSPGTINLGELVYVAGWNVGTDIAEIELAQADSEATMPAVGIAAEAITNTVAGKILIIGSIVADTSAFALGDELFASAAVAGEYTNVPPVGPNIRQLIGLVARVHPSQGIVVSYYVGATGFAVASPEPVDIGDTNSASTSPYIARDKHVHAHGSHTEPTNHALVVAGASHGFMDEAQQTKLDGIAPGAVADHGSLAGVTANQHHNQQHAIDGADHIVPAGSAGKALLVNQGETLVAVSPYAASAANKSGVFEGMVLSEATPTTLAISDGFGAVVDHEFPITSPPQSVVASGLTSIAIPLIATTTVSFLLVTPGGAPLIVSDVEPSEQQYTDNAYVGWATHPGAVITHVNPDPRVAYGLPQGLSALLGAFAPYILSGINVTGNAGLNYAISSGVFWEEGGNHANSRRDAHRVVYGGTASALMDLVFSNGVDGGATNVITTDATDILPGQAEVPLGTNTAIAGSPNQATIQRIYATPFGVIFHALGQTIFSSLTAAFSAAGNEPFVESGLIHGSTLLARLVVRSGATGLLTDGDAVVIMNGSGAGSSGGSGGVTTFLQLLDTFGSFAGLGGNKLLVNLAENAIEAVADPVGATETDFGSLAGNQSLDFVAGRNARMTLLGNVTVTALSFPEPGHYQLKVLTGAGGFDITFTAAVDWAGGVIFAATAAGGAKDYINFYFDGTDVSAQFSSDFQ